jgi:hypothetical protein
MYSSGRETKMDRKQKQAKNVGSPQVEKIEGVKAKVSSMNQENVTKAVDAIGRVLNIV